MSDGDEWVTISQAAKRLGIHERQVRRYADRLPTSDRTPAGQRPVSFRFAAISRLRQDSLSGQVRLEPSPDRTGHGQDTQDSVPSESELGREQIAAFYERMLQEKDARIQRLETDLEFAQEQARAWQQRDALTAAPEPQDATVEGADSAEGKVLAEGEKSPENGAQTRRGWFARLFRGEG